ncbi:MAG: hypothetical protein ACOC9Q_00695 [bacterium]
MPKRWETRIASLGLMLSVFAMTVFLILIFYVSQFIPMWVNMNRELALWEVWAARLSIASVSWSFPLFILLSSLFVASLTWRIMTYIQLRQRTTG